MKIFWPFWPQTLFQAFNPQKNIDFWNISFPGFKTHSCSTLLYIKNKFPLIGCDCIMSRSRWHDGSSGCHLECLLINLNYDSRHIISQSKMPSIFTLTTHFFFNLTSFFPDRNLHFWDTEMVNQCLYSSLKRSVGANKKPSSCETLKDY